MVKAKTMHQDQGPRQQRLNTNGARHNISTVHNRRRGHWKCNRRDRSILAGNAMRPRCCRNQDSRRHYYRYLQAQHEVVAHLIKYKERARDREPAEHTITVARVNATLSPCPLCSRLEGLELPRCKRAMYATEAELACLVMILYHAVRHL